MSLLSFLPSFIGELGKNEKVKKLYPLFLHSVQHTLVVSNIDSHREYCLPFLGWFSNNLSDFFHCGWSEFLP